MGLLSMLGVDPNAGGGLGLLGQLGQGLHDNSNALLGFASGGPEGMVRGKMADLQSAASRQEQEDKKKLLAWSEQVAKSTGRPELAGNPALAQQYWLAANKPKDPQLIGSADTGYTWATPGQALPESFTTPRPKPDVQLFQDRNSGEITAVDKRSLAHGVVKPGQPKPPAEKEIPGDLAGRLALTEEYLTHAPEIEKEIASGNMTGLIDGPAARSGYGRGGEVYRQIRSGVDGLRRSLTGAGMPAEEAKEYADRYLPQVSDTQDKLLSKHRQLTAELSRFRENARQGRGPVPPLGGGAQPPAQQKPEAPSLQKGMTATNPKTGQRIIFDGSKWVAAPDA